jgi:hypothetical protein
MFLAKITNIKASLDENLHTIKDKKVADYMNDGGEFCERLGYYVVANDEKSMVAALRRLVDFTLTVQGVREEVKNRYTFYYEYSRSEKDDGQRIQKYLSYQGEWTTVIP